MEKAQSITSLGDSPEVERRSRMIKYTIAMTIRVVCIVAALFVEGWLMWVAFAGAILLPYFAVVIANAQDSRPQKLDPVVKVAKPLSFDLSQNESQQK